MACKVQPYAEIKSPNKSNIYMGNLAWKTVKAERSPAYPWDHLCAVTFLFFFRKDRPLFLVPTAGRASQSLGNQVVLGTRHISIERKKKPILKGLPSPPTRVPGMCPSPRPKQYCVTEITNGLLLFSEGRKEWMSEPHRLLGWLFRVGENR